MPVEPQVSEIPRRLPYFALACAFAAAACSNETSGAEHLRSSYELREIERYGWQSLADSTRPLTDEERAYSGAVLGDPLDIAEDTAGFVYVLDAGFQKIVVFSPAGDLARVILGGHGDGPGEFRRPRSIALGHDGDIWVYDQISRRITRFDRQGKVDATLQPNVAGALDLAVVGERVYLTQLSQIGEPSIAVLDTLGNVIQELLPLEPVDVRLAGAPAAPALGDAHSMESVVVFHPDAGSWTEISDMQVQSREGTSLFVDFQSHVHEHSTGSEPTEVEEIYVWGGSELPDGRTMIYYVLNRMTGSETDRMNRLAIFSESNEYLGSVPVAADRGTFASSQAGPDILVVQSDPFPQIVRMRLVPRGN